MNIEDIITLVWFGVVTLVAALLAYTAGRHTGQRDGYARGELHGRRDERAWWERALRN